MKINRFLLEDYYEKHEFSTQYMLSSSDPETWSLDDILQLANKEELQLWHNQTFGYTEVFGSLLLRDTIAQSLYPQCTRDNILCFAGAEEGIFCSLLALCSPHDHVIVITPCYQSLKEIPTFAGCKVSEIPLDEKNDWKIDIQAIKDAITSHTKAVVINFPHNPTGQIITQKELEELVLLLKQHDIWLFSDEVYRLLSYQNISWTDPAVAVYDKAISLGVMSKAYGLPGLRIGWIACQNRAMLQQIAQIKHYTSLCNSGPAEILSSIVLRNQDIVLHRNQEILVRNMQSLETFFVKYKHLFSWVKPQAGCTGFVKYHGTEDITQFCDRVRQRVGVLLLPGSVYGMSTNHFRIGFGRSNMLEALTQLEVFLEQEKL